MLVVVGDVDPIEVEAVIRRRFAEWQAIGPVPKPQPAATFQPSRIAPISYSDSAEGLTAVTASVTMRSPAPLYVPSQRMEAMLMDMVATRAAASRLDAGRAGAPAGRTGAFIESGTDGYRLILLWNYVAPGGWPSGVTGLSDATCDLSRRGWSEAEWSSAKRDVVKDLEQRSSDMSNVPNVELAKELSHAVAAAQIPIAPDELLGHAKAWLHTVDAKIGSAWWAEQWRRGAQTIRVEAPELAKIKDPRSAIRGVLDEHLNKKGTCRAVRR